MFFYESVLRTNHFGYLPNLQSLSLEFCKIRRIPSLAFSGLSGLQELVIRTHNSEWSAMVMELESDAFTGKIFFNVTIEVSVMAVGNFYCEAGEIR